MPPSIINLYRASRWALREGTRPEKLPEYSVLKRFSKAVGLARYCIDMAMTASRETRGLVEHEFKRTDFEKALPFLKSSGWLYMSYAPYFLVALSCVKDRETFDKVLEGTKLLSETNVTYFFSHPSTFPFDRKGKNPLTRRKPIDLLYKYAYYFDSGNVTFPSQHVSLSAFAGLSLYHAGYKISGKIMLLWTVLISATTLTTKQHYQVDIIAALILATLGHDRYVRKNENASMDELREESERLFRDLISGDYRPAEPLGLKNHIDPVIIEIMENIRRLNPFSSIYSEIVIDTLSMIKSL